jgi:hypothetical protein
MRRIVVVMQSTLNNRIGTSEFGVFWEPFPWGEPEQTWLNGAFRAADTWGDEPEDVRGDRAMVGGRGGRSATR